MASAKTFKQLAAWQFSVDASRVIFDITGEGCTAADREFRDQIRAAADAAAPLIAEGFLRFTTREFARYLRMARGELGEVQAYLEQARVRGYFGDDQLRHAESMVARAMGTTTNLLKSQLRKIEEQAPRTKRRR